MPGFNPYAIPSVPAIAPMPLPQVDPNAGFKALAAIQNTIARQQAASARGAGGSGGSPKYTSSAFLPKGNGEFERVSVEGGDKENRAEQLKQLWRLRVQDLAKQDKSLQDSLSKIGTASVVTQKKELDKIRQQDFPRLFRQWNIPPDQQGEIVKMFTTEAKNSIDRQQTAIKATGTFQTLVDSTKLGFNSLADAIKGLGQTPEEQYVLGEARNKERQEIIDSNPYLKEQELRRAENVNSWTDFTEAPGKAMASGVGEMLAGAGSYIATGGVGAKLGAMAGSLAGPAGAAVGGTLGAIIGGGLTGGALGPIDLADRIVAEVNAGRMTREQGIAALEKGELTAQVTGAVAGAIPGGLGKVGIPLLSKGAGSYLGRRYIQQQAAKAALAEGATAEAAKAIGKNAVSDAVAAQAQRWWPGRYVSAIPTTSLDMATIAPVNVLGQNIAFNYATGQNTPLTQGMGEAAIQGALTGPLFATMNTARPRIPARKPVPDMLNPEMYPVENITVPETYKGARGATPEGAAKLNEYIVNAKQFGPKQRSELTAMLHNNEVTIDDIAVAARTQPENSPARYSLAAVHDDFLNMQRSWDEGSKSPGNKSDIREGSAESKQFAEQFLAGMPEDMNIRDRMQLVYNALFDGATHGKDLMAAVKKSKMQPEIKREIVRAVNNADNFLRSMPPQIEGVSSGKTSATEQSGSATGGGSRTAPTVGSDERQGQGSPDRANTTGSRPATADTETLTAGTAVSTSDGVTQGNSAIERGGDVGVSTPHPATTEAIARAVDEQTQGGQRPADGESGSAGPTLASAEPDIRERSNQLATGTGAWSDGTPAATSGNKSDAVAIAAQQVADDAALVSELNVPKESERPGYATLQKQFDKNAEARDALYTSKMEAADAAIKAGEVTSKKELREFLKGQRDPNSSAKLDAAARKAVFKDIMESRPFNKTEADIKENVYDRWNEAPCA